MFVVKPIVILIKSLFKNKINAREYNDLSYRQNES